MVLIDNGQYNGNEICWIHAHWRVELHVWEMSVIMRTFCHHTCNPNWANYPISLRWTTPSTLMVLCLQPLFVTGLLFISLSPMESCFLLTFTWAPHALKISVFRESNPWLLATVLVYVLWIEWDIQKIWSGSLPVSFV